MRSSLANILPVLLTASLVYMTWKLMCCISDSPRPLIVVASNSMAPTLSRGDICLLWNRKSPIEVGDIPVVWFANHSLPMVHRAIESHWEEDKHQPSQPQ